jgi:predicted enzyme related to lactoylglutathione lyase
MSDEKFEAGTFCWNELMTPDVEKAKAFYQGCSVLS